MLAIALVSCAAGGCALATSVAGIGDSPSRSAECKDDVALEPWDSIVSGALLMTPPGSEPGSMLRIGMPVGVTARGNEVYIADAGRQALVRYDAANRRVRKVIPLPGLTADSTIYLDRALTMYVALPAAGQIVELDIDSRPLRTFEHAAITRPSGLAMDESRRELLVADGPSGRVGVFSASGMLVRAIGTGPGVTDPPAAADHIAVAPDQLYIVDRALGAVHLFALDGTFRYAFGQDALGIPGPITVDAYNRVHIADLADQTIKTFRGGELLAVTGGSGTRRGPRFQQITSLWESDGQLYVADAGSASIEVLRVMPPCPA